MSGPVATCAGSSGGAQPPPNPRRLPEYCESAPATRNRWKRKQRDGQRKGRGKAKGVDIAAYVATHGRIRLTFEKSQKTWKAVGPHAAWYDSAIGIHTRNCCEPFYDMWKQVPAQQKAAIYEMMLSWFDIDMSGIICGVLDRDAQRAYKDWKSDLADYFRKFNSIEEALTNPPNTIRAPEHWQRCCERFVSPKFQTKSNINKKNRAVNTIPSHHGRKSYMQRRTDKADPETHELYPAIENWKDMRTPGGQWINNQAEQKYNMMVERRQRQLAQSRLGLAKVNENIILENVLGKRRGRRNGIGPTLSQTWLHYSEVQSIARMSIASSSTEYRARIRKLENKISRLERVIRRLAPDELPSSDDDEASSSPSAAHNHDEDEVDI